MPERSFSWKPNKPTRSVTRSRVCASGPRSCGGIFDFDVKTARLAAVDRELEDPRVWDDPARAQELGREKKQLDGVVLTLSDLGRELDDSDELYALARAEADDATFMKSDELRAWVADGLGQLS